MGFLQNLRDDIVFVRGALRALKMTTHIAKNPTRAWLWDVSGSMNRLKRFVSTPFSSTPTRSGRNQSRVISAALPASVLVRVASTKGRTSRPIRRWRRVIQ